MSPSPILFLTNMKIKIKQIIRWEQLRDKPFYELDATDELDVVALMYVTAPEQDIDNSTFETFQQVADSAACEKLSKSISRYLNYVNQFSPKIKADDKPVEDSKDEDKKEEQIRVSEISTGLIFDGVGANYLLNDAEICDLPMLCKGAEMKMRREKEDSRLWAFLQLQPYMNSKVKTTTDFYPFPWEDEGKPVVVTDDDLAMAEALLTTTKEN